MSVLTVSFLAAQIAAGAPFHTSYAPEQTPTGPAAVVEAMSAPGDVFAAEALLSEAELRARPAVSPTQLLFLRTTR